MPDDTADRISKEQRLRSAVLRGDEVAWRVWYEESFADLLAYVTWRCGGKRDQAAEIVQETWLIAVRQIRKFDPEKGSFVNWLCGVAGNALRNQVRRENRIYRSCEQLTGEITSETESQTEGRTEQSDRITQALVALPPRYEEVLKAKYLDELSVKTIALRWNQTPSTIESLLTRAREAFRRLYSDPDCEWTSESDADRPTDSLHKAP